MIFFELMKLKLTTLFIFILIAVDTFSQEKPTVINGKIYGLKAPVPNVHIINLGNGFGAVSNNQGVFELLVSKNDTLLISSIQYEKKYIGITNLHISSKKIVIALKPLVTILDEVFLHKLSGSIVLDLSMVPEDTIPKHNFELKQSDFNKIYNFPNEGAPIPNALAITDPTFMNGVGGSATIPDFYMIKKRQLRKSLNKKKVFPEKLIKVLGSTYFIKILNIPKDKINHFISYCESRNIADLYYENKLLEVIEILKEESGSYHVLEKN